MRLDRERGRGIVAFLPRSLLHEDPRSLIRVELFVEVSNYPCCFVLRTCESNPCFSAFIARQSFPYYHLDPQVPGFATQH